MIVYFGRRFSSALVGSRVVELDCEKCARRFYYQLARVGSGEATAPYNIGVKRAEEKAGRKAQKDLDRRLEGDAELVPCPDCQWVNQDLVVGFRRTQYQGWQRAALWLGGSALVVSLILGASWQSGPNPDTRTALIVTLVGVSLSIGGSLILFGFRELQRRRISPNRDHPFTPPRVPVGSPPALRLDQATQLFEPTSVAAPIEERGGVGHYVQIGRIDLPGDCCGCGNIAHPQASPRRVLINPLALTIPLCQPCATRWTRARWVGGLLGASLAAVGIAPLLYWAFGRVDSPEFLVPLSLITVIGLGGGLGVVARRSAPARVWLVDRSRGVVRLWFRNRAYLLGPSEMVPVAPTRFVCEPADSNPYQPPRA